jgi:protein-S-isoprenylcysteine O-methyltransferase Ste14
MYTKLAKKEEKKMVELFGEKYEEYRKQVPAFIPKRLSHKGR